MAQKLILEDLIPNSKHPNAEYRQWMIKIIAFIKLNPFLWMRNQIRSPENRQAWEEIGTSLNVDTDSVINCWERTYDGYLNKKKYKTSNSPYFLEKELDFLLQFWIENGLLDAKQKEKEEKSQKSPQTPKIISSFYGTKSSISLAPPSKILLTPQNSETSICSNSSNSIKQPEKRQKIIQTNSFLIDELGGQFKLVPVVATVSNFTEVSTPMDDDHAILEVPKQQNKIDDIAQFDDGAVGKDDNNVEPNSENSTDYACGSSELADVPKLTMTYSLPPDFSNSFKDYQVKKLQWMHNRISYITDETRNKFIDLMLKVLDRCTGYDSL